MTEERKKYIIDYLDWALLSYFKIFEEDKYKVNKKNLIWAIDDLIKENYIK